jgi:hypothetical protein
LNGRRPVGRCRGRSSWLSVLARRRPGRGRRRPAQAWPPAPRPRPRRWIEHCPSSAVQLRCWSRPRITTRLPLARDSAACSAWSRHTITVKNDGSCSRRLRHGHPEQGPGDPTLGVADLGVVGEVAGKAHAGLGHGGAVLGLVAGRSALSLDPGDGGHPGMPNRVANVPAVTPCRRENRGGSLADVDGAWCR